MVKDSRVQIEYQGVTEGGKNKCNKLQMSSISTCFYSYNNEWAMPHELIHCCVCCWPNISIMEMLFELNWVQRIKLITPLSLSVWIHIKLVNALYIYPFLSTCKSLLNTGRVVFDTLPVSSSLISKATECIHVHRCSLNWSYKTMNEVS